MNVSGGDPRKTVRVAIAGEDYTIRTEADEDYTRRCAALVDQRMKAIAGEGAAGAAQTRAAIMAALSIADDLFQQRTRTRERAAELAKRVEEALQEEDGATTGGPGAKDDPNGGHGASDMADATESNDFAAGDFASADAAKSDFAADDFPPPQDTAPED